MPFSDPEQAKRLIALAQDDTQIGCAYDAVAACGADGANAAKSQVEPLFAYYSKSLLPAVERAIAGGDYSLNRILRGANTLRVTLEDARALLNVNYPEDYEKLIGMGESR
jgi:molybdopterin-guanine dinucleotide biosynthesis protein A